MRNPKNTGNGDDDSIGANSRHGHSYYVDSSIYINDYAPFSSILAIHNLTSNHNGNYTCVISNQGGVVEHTAVLSVAGSYSDMLLYSVFVFCSRDLSAHMHTEHTLVDSLFCL